MILIVLLFLLFECSHTQKISVLLFLRWRLFGGGGREEGEKESAGDGEEGEKESAGDGEGG